MNKPAEMTTLVPAPKEEPRSRTGVFRGARPPAQDGVSPADAQRHLRGGRLLTPPPLVAGLCGRGVATPPARVRVFAERSDLGVVDIVRYPRPAGRSRRRCVPSRTAPVRNAFRKPPF